MADGATRVRGDDIRDAAEGSVESKTREKRVRFIASLFEAYLETLASPKEALLFEFQHNRCAVCGEILGEEDRPHGSA